MPPQVFRQIGEDLWEAFPDDLRVSLEDLVSEGDQIKGRITISGTFAGNLWGLDGDREVYSLTSPISVRFEGEKCAIRLEGVNLGATLRKLGILPTPDQAHLPPKHALEIPEIIHRLLFNNMQLKEKDCEHLALIRIIEPSSNVCQQCVESGDKWPALRMCLVCGFVGCCDLSVNKHMIQHFEETGHPIFRSINMKERWIWCYEDHAFLSSRHLAK